MKVKQPEYQITHSNAMMIVRGKLRPTARSVSYDFKIEYWLNRHPVITIAEGQLLKNEKKESIPHMYEQKFLCLYKPKYQQFKPSDFLADIIVPLISLWLFHYENWHVTGKWQGGGEHPAGRRARA